MTTFGWSYKKNYSGSQPGAILSKVHQKNPDNPNAKTIGDASASERKYRGSLASRLYVGGLAWKTSEAEIKHYFSTFGDVVDIRIITDRETGFSRGFGFITFESRDIAERCKKWCSSHSPMLGDRPIHVEYAERHSDRQQRHKPSARENTSMSASTSASTAASNPADSQHSDADGAGKGSSSAGTWLSVDKCHWQFKWSKSAEDVHGPYPSAHIQAWVTAKYFTADVVVRQVDAYEYNDFVRQNSTVGPEDLSGEFVAIGEVDLSMFP
ncbi:ELAV-like protein 1 isoform X2 [Sycon ciliatum]|uniref:ELAV-like protein 1 isoform X2 n=1 Tax=Sycon ciliatum TaxID=27933 RepID=UPI0031F71747